MGLEHAPPKQDAESPPGAIQHVMVGKLTSEVKRLEQTGRTDRAGRSKVQLGNPVQIRDPLRHQHSDRLLRRHTSDFVACPLCGDLLVSVSLVPTYRCAAFPLSYDSAAHASKAAV